MVLVNGLTIHKSIDNDYKLDDIIDTSNIQNAECRRQRGKFHHKTKRNGTDFGATDATKGLQEIQDFLKLISTTAQSHPKKIDKQHAKVPHTQKTVKKKKTKGHNFWKKFHHKDKNKQNGKASKGGRNVKKSLFRHGKTTVATTVGTKSHEINVITYPQIMKDEINPYLSELQRIKKETATENQIEKYHNTNATGKNLNDKTKIANIARPEHKDVNVKRINDNPLYTKSYAPMEASNKLTTALTQLTNKVTMLKNIYGLNRKKPGSSFLDILLANSTNDYSSTFVDPLSTRNIKHKTAVTTRDDSDSSEITRIEAMLSDITQKDAEYITMQSPFLTNLISNAVTTATFYLNKAVNGSNSFNPNYEISKRSPASDMDLVIDRPFSSDNTHGATVRSFKDDTIIIAQGIEDKLQNELKNMYKKIKNKLSSDLRKEINETKTTIKKKWKEKTCKTARVTKTTTMLTLPQLPITTPTKARIIRNKSFDQKPETLENTDESETEISHTIPIIGDDFTMLSLYEQLIAKSNHDNIWKMLATQSRPLQRHIREKKLSKRNFESLADISLKENLEKIYNDGVIMPDEYIDSGKDTDENESQGDSYSTGATTVDTSFEGISNKLYYNDYVNGYKYYLKFQNKKDQEDEKYSNLVRYQAHKHHKVDDIGKYILNKIPTVQPTKEKRFVDSGTLEDQEISTKSEDSWFKRHFYVFLDKEPPKKFHSSETVELKPQTFMTTRTMDFRVTNKLQKDNKDASPSMKIHKDKKDKKNKSNEKLKQKKAFRPAINYNDEDYEANNNILVDTNRFKRNLSDDINFIDVQVTDKPINNVESKTAFNNIENLSKSAVANKKMGYVEINMVHKPTAIVKLHDSKKKKHRIQGLLEKLHLRKKSKSKVEKREQRVERFNPVKKIKEIFKIKDNDMSTTMVDYEFVTPHNSQKIVKHPYQSPTELVHQIPNITEDRSYNLAKYDEKYMKNIFKDENLDEGTHSSKTEEQVTRAGDYSFTTDRKTAFTKQSLRTTSMQKIQGTTRTTKSQFTTDDILKVNVHNIHSIPDVTTTTASTNLLFDIIPSNTWNVNDKLDKIQIVLSTKEQNNSPTTLPIINTSSNRYTNLDEIQEYEEDIPNELLLNNDSTKLAKYPKRAHKKSKSNGLVDEPQMYEFVDDNGQTEKYKSTNELKEPTTINSKQGFIRSDYSENSDLVSTVDDKVQDEIDLSKPKSIPDYFNDLILWHNDILNENVSPVLNTMFKQGYSDSKNGEDGINKSEIDSKIKNDGFVDKKDNSRKLYGTQPQKTSKKNMKSAKDNRLNKIARRTGQKNVNIGKSTTENIDLSDAEDENNPELMVDTTVFAYDDSLPLLEDKEPKKISKNSVQFSATKKNTEPEFKTLTKINLPPKQYYSTPLPMSNDDFEKFLKENQIDVNSVTSPMPMLPKVKPCGIRNQYLSKISTKIFGGDAIMNDVSNSEEQTIKFSISKDSKQINPNLNKDNLKQEQQLNDYLKTDTEKNLLYTERKFEYPKIRIRKSANSNSYENPKPQNFNVISYNKLKELLTNFKNNDMSLEDIKANTKKFANKKDVEVTVIDFDDLAKAKHKNVKATSNLMDEITSKVNSNMEPTWLESGKNFFQHNFLQKHKGNLYVTTETVTEKTTIKFKSAPNVLLAKDVKGVPKEDAAPDFTFYQVPADKEPKSVHITSHTYRYDIFYDQPINKMSTKEAVSSPINFAKSLFNLDKITEPETNLESTTPFIITNKEIVGKGAFVYDLKHEKQKNKQIQKRFRPLTGLLKEFKRRMKNSSTAGTIATSKTTKSSPMGLCSDLSTVTNMLKVLDSDYEKDNIAYNDYNMNDLEEVTGLTASTLPKSTNLLLSNEILSTLRSISSTVRDKDESLKPTLSSTTKRLTASNKKKNRMKMTKSMVKDMNTDTTHDEGTTLSLRLKLVPIDDKVSNSNPKNTKVKNNYEGSSLKDEHVGVNKVRYEPMVELNDRKFNNNKEDKLKIQNAVTPVDVTTDEEILQDIENEVNIATVTIPNVKNNMHYEDMQKKVPDSAYTNYDDIYYEPIIDPNTKHIIVNETASNFDGTKHGKRNVQTDEVFTAKDVAALEVVVDLMKNTLNYQQKNAPNPNEDTNKPDYIYLQTTPLDKSSRTTNAIQVHIAIPYIMTDKKRSLGPVRVRRVFSAIMSTPVDIKYQIHTFEDTTPAFATTNNILSPGLYLLVDSKNSTMPKGDFFLKPIRSDALSNVMFQDYNELVTPRMKTPIESTATPNTIVVNKDVLATLMQMYNKCTTVKENKVKREVDVTTKKPKSNKVKQVFSNIHSELVKLRHIDWGAVKDYFGYDRTCNCRCKANKTMCRACAASDAVMSELIFEFDNMAKYMNDHCTEIQTFFRMSPSGGRKLKDVVHKMDKTLDDYYKRVGGKCRGQTCNAFLYMDKRNIQPSDTIANYTISNSFLENLETLASDLKRAVTYDTCNKKLFIKGKECLDEIAKCVPVKLLNKRSDKNDKRNGKYVKQVYSLDNINVNIICNTDLSTEEATNRYASTDVLQDLDSISSFHSLEDVRRSMKKRKGLRRLFGKKTCSKRKNYNIDNGINVTPNMLKKSFKKRQIIDVSQIESPLIADSGGSFWYDYIKRKTHESTTERDNVFMQKSSILNKSSTKITEKDEQSSHDNVLANNKAFATESLSKHIDELSKILGVSNIHKTSSIYSTKSLKNSTKMKDKLKASENIYTTKKSSQKKINDKVGHKTTYKPLVQKIDIPKKKIPSTSTKKIKTNSSLRTKTLKTNNNKITKTLKPINSEQTVSKSSETTESMNPSPKQKNVNAFDAAPDKIVAENKKIPELKTKFYNNGNNKLSTKALTKSKTTTRRKTLQCTEPICWETTKSLLHRLKSVTSKYIHKIPWHFRGTQKASNAEELAEQQFNVDHRIIRNLPNEPIETSGSNEYITENDIGNTKKDVTIDKLNEYSTILIINNKVNTDKPSKANGYMKNNERDTRDLLLSVLNFESDLLNDEWDKYVKKESAQIFFDYSVVDPEKKDFDFTIPNSVTTQSLFSSSENTPSAKSKMTSSHAKVPVKMINNLLLKLSLKKSTTTMKVVHDENMKSTNSLKSGMKNNDQQNENDLRKNKKGLDNVQGHGYICDLPATFKHVLIQQQKLTKNAFESYVKDLKCSKFKKVPDNFLVTLPNQKERETKEERKFVNNFKIPVRWNWVRHKRLSNFRLDNENINDSSEISIDYNENAIKTFKLRHDFNKKHSLKRSTSNKIVSLRNMNDYEKLCKGEDGIYRDCKYRVKRATDISDLIQGLRNLPLLQPQRDEIYAMVGDTVSFDCHTPSAASDLDGDQHRWMFDETEVLSNDNIDIDKTKVTIKDVQAKNYGTYVCSKDNAEIKNVTLTVVTLPVFDVVFPSVYSCNVCSYKDLRSMNALGSVMTHAVCDRECSIRVTEPVCLRNEMDQSLIQSMVSLKMELPPKVRCGMDCKRNLLCSLVLLAVTTVPTIQSVGVILMYDGFNKSLTTSNAKSKRTVVTHTLRRDSRDTHKYHDLIARMNPGDIDVVVSCPAGYFLVADQKICIICPANTWSGEGGNTCLPCPRNAESGPGSSHCTLSDRLPRSCRWHWLLYFYGVLACLAVCLATAFSVMLRHHFRQPSNVRFATTRGTGRTKAARDRKRFSPRRHASAPSRVLLSELLRASSSSTVFNYNDDDYKLWKAKTTPPPLPPIDF